MDRSTPRVCFPAGLYSLPGPILIFGNCIIDGVAPVANDGHADLLREQASGESGTARPAD